LEAKACAPPATQARRHWYADFVNTSSRSATDLTAAVKNRLNRMRYRPNQIDCYFTGTGLSPPTPTRP